MHANLPLALPLSSSAIGTLQGRGRDGSNFLETAKMCGLSPGRLHFLRRSMVEGSRHGGTFIPTQPTAVQLYSFGLNLCL